MSHPTPTTAEPPAGDSRRPLDFIRRIVTDDVAAGRNGGRVVTRFPPEPNGYLHIGHAKSICLNFGIAAEFGGRCHLRFDDTNPVKEEQEYIDNIKRDVAWLGFDWGKHEYYASDYFERLYQWAEDLIRAGKAFVCDQSAEEIRAHRGTLTQPGRASPCRDRSPQESLDLFRRMRAGEFPDGARVLRARIDMASPNINLRDPVMYRILRARHPRTGDAWCIYPTYDWAHGQSDSIESITHSICTLEFEDHRPLYDWFIEALGIHHPQQIEFARLDLNYTMMSKRKLLELVKEGRVSGWDDPRMPTLSGMRRRGYTPEAIRAFSDRVGVAKRNNVIEIDLLEHFVREDLNRKAPRRMAVLNPLRLVIDDWPAGREEEVEAVNNPEDSSAGSRAIPFGRELYIERDDFMEDPPPKYHRLAPGRRVRLRWAYVVTCTGVERDAGGRVITVRCTHEPGSRGASPEGPRVKGIIHWVPAARAVPAEVRLYDRLFATPDPGADYRANLNPESLVVLTGAMLEPSLTGAAPGAHFQFERQGYFCVDREATARRLVVNRTVPLRDSWAKIARQDAGGD
jgi:glutaminyl-tRNA synthetase